jgi:hypothetical protein
MTVSTPETAPTMRPAARAPSISWVVQRAALGLAIMAVLTSIATYLAYASIETSAESAPATISIGTPAAAMLKRN